MTQRQQQQQQVKAAPSFAVSSVILLLSISSLLLCQSFQIQSQFSSTRSSSSSSTRSSSSSSSRHSSLSSTLQRRSSSPHFYADPSLHDNEETAPAGKSFEQRMREQLRQRQSIARQEQKISSYNTTPTRSTTKTRKTNVLIPDVRSLEDYKNVLDQAAEDDKMVAVFWYSPWCKACKAASPGFKTIAKNHPQIQFIQVPVLEDNAVLHQGLNVPSVPYMHLYTPDDPRLVEESKMTRKKLSGFQKLLQDYEDGSCSLERLGLVDSDDVGGGWSTTCPYSFSTTTLSTNTNTNSNTVEVVTP